jgi:tetratricopeptide (TPR) repeat protein
MLKTEELIEQIGNCLTKARYANSPEEAISDYRKCLALDPTNYYILLLRGKALKEIGRYELAIADLEASIASFITVNGYKELMSTYAENLQPDKVQATYDKAPEDLKELLRPKLSQLTEAQLAFQEALKKD